MGAHYEQLEKKCSKCGEHLETVSMKNPFLDNSEDQCSNEQCEDHGKALESLTRSARNEANREEARERAFEREQEEVDNSDNNEKDD